MKAQFMVSARLLFGNSSLVSVERNNLYLTSISKKSAVFHIFTVTMSIGAFHSISFVADGTFRVYKLILFSYYVIFSK